jgi:L-alanine-DL-glutamate epimerase-like enolase superfamily enzyme
VTGPAITAARVEALRLRNLDPDWAYGKVHVPALDGVLVTLTAEDGTEGHGYAPVLSHLAVTAEVLLAGAETLAKAAVGAPALSPAAAAQRMDRRMGGARAARSAVECATQDLAARVLGVPLHVLFGGAVRDRIPLVRIVPLKPPAAMAEAASAIAAEGYRSIKLKASGDLPLDLARVRAVREAVGETLELMVDANQAYEPKRALEFARAVMTAGVTWLEQPVPAGDLAGLALTTRESTVGVEADEAVATPEDVVRLAASRAVDGISLKLTKSGGLAPVAAMVAVAAASGLRCRMGTAFGSALIAAHSAHLAAALPAFAGFAECAKFAHFEGDAFAPPAIEDGCLVLPSGPGSGLSRLS